MWSLDVDADLKTKSWQSCLWLKNKVLNNNVEGKLQ